MATPIMGANMQMLEMQAFNPLQVAEQRAFGIREPMRPLVGAYEPPYKYYGIAEQNFEPVENIWDKQARLEQDWAVSSRKSVLDDLDRGIMPQTGAALNAFNDSRDHSSFNTSRYGLNSGLSDDDFYVPPIIHDVDDISPVRLTDRFESSFRAPVMRHSRYDDDFEAPNVDKTFRKMQEAADRRYEHQKALEEERMDRLADIL